MIAFGVMGLLCSALNACLACDEPEESRAILEIAQIVCRRNQDDAGLNGVCAVVKHKLGRRFLAHALNITL